MTSDSGGNGHGYNNPVTSPRQDDNVTTAGLTVATVQTLRKTNLNNKVGIILSKKENNSPGSEYKGDLTSISKMPAIFKFHCRPNKNGQ